MEQTELNNKKILNDKIIIGIIILVIILIVLIGRVILPRYNYQKGNEAYNSGNYAQAITYYQRADNYLDSNEKFILATQAQHYVGGIAAIAEKNYELAADQLIAAADYDGAYDKLLEVALLAFDEQQYDISAKAFDAVPNLEDENKKWFAHAMTDFLNKDYYSAIGKFRKVTKTDGGLDTADYINKCSVMLAESSWDKGNYATAKALYETLPKNYEYNGINVSKRLNILSIYEKVKDLEGSYKVTKSDYKVRSIHVSTGISEGWNGTGGYGFLTVSVRIKKDGTVNILGSATGTRYTKYSSIAEGLQTGYFYANFEKAISEGGLPVGTLYSDNETTLKYLGGNKFKLTYSKDDRSQDVYFNYKYTADYTFSK